MDTSHLHDDAGLIPRQSRTVLHLWDWNKRWSDNMSLFSISGLFAPPVLNSLWWETNLPTVIIVSQLHFISVIGQTEAWHHGFCNEKLSNKKHQWRWRSDVDSWLVFLLRTDRFCCDSPGKAFYLIFVKLRRLRAFLNLDSISLSSQQLLHKTTEGIQPEKLQLCLFRHNVYVCFLTVTSSGCMNYNCSIVSLQWSRNS